MAEMSRLNLRDDAPQGFRWRLTGGPPLPIIHALQFGEAVRSAIYRTADRHGLFPLPDAFHRGVNEEHNHAFWLPEDADADGSIDHVLLFAEIGLPDRLIPVLAAGGTVFLGKLGEWRLAPDWMGRRGQGGLFGPAWHWNAVTPYVTPFRGKQTKPGGPQDPEHQLREELGLRRMPKPARLVFSPEIMRGSSVVEARAFACGFRRSRPGIPR
jgi:CRISPR-associated protein Csb2